MSRQAGLHRRALPAVLLLLAVAGCATSPPVQEMSDARQAIAAAREAGAGQYAAAAIQVSETRLVDAERQLKAHSYALARRSALAAKNTAFQALLDSRSAREAARTAAP